jgi:hypothetical protein
MDNTDSLSGTAPASAPPATLPEDDFKSFDEFGPVPVRHRYDGWTPDRQHAFIVRLAECGCVDEAAKAVGMGRTSAYALKARADAQAFRLAWEAALDFAVGRLSDAALSRAINGVAVPIFHKGEQVGERRHFDERLTMFMLRYRDPVRYGKWMDRRDARRVEDGPLSFLHFRLGRMLRAAWTAFNAELDGKPTPKPEAEILFEMGANDENGPRLSH